MALRQVKISELNNLHEEPGYSRGGRLPIIPARAHSQSLNPFATPGDVALIIARDEENNDLVGFIGAFPSSTTRRDVPRVIWVSNWWVSESARGQGLAQTLIAGLLEIYGNTLALPDLTLPTLKIINKTGLFHTMRRNGIILYIRPGFSAKLSILGFPGKKYPLVANALNKTGIPWLADFLTDALLWPFQGSGTAFSKTLKPTQLDKPGKQDYEFMEQFSTHDLHLPAEKELNMPSWLEKPSSANKHLSSKYSFSIYAKEFKVFWLRWKENDEIVALTMLTLRDGTLKTPYVYCAEGFKPLFAGQFMKYCLGNNQIKTLVTSCPLLVEYIDSRRFCILARKKFVRYSGISLELMKYFPDDLTFQDGDGDSRFT